MGSDPVGTRVQQYSRYDMDMTMTMTMGLISRYERVGPPEIVNRAYLYCAINWHSLDNSTLATCAGLMGAFARFSPTKSTPPASPPAARRAHNPSLVRFVSSPQELGFNSDAEHVHLSSCDPHAPGVDQLKTHTPQIKKRRKNAERAAGPISPPIAITKK